MIELIVGTVILLGVGIGLWCFGSWIGSQKLRPIGFWANGKPMEVLSISDVPGYNSAYGKLFRIFSIPACCAGVLLFLSAILHILAYISLVILILWGTVGLLWLIVSYKKIENQFILR